MSPVIREKFPSNFTVKMSPIQGFSGVFRSWSKPFLWELFRVFSGYSKQTKIIEIYLIIYVYLYILYFLLHLIFDTFVILPGKHFLYEGIWNHWISCRVLRVSTLGGSGNQTSFSSNWGEGVEYEGPWRLGNKFKRRKEKSIIRFVYINLSV